MQKCIQKGKFQWLTRVQGVYHKEKMKPVQEAIWEELKKMLQQIFFVFIQDIKLSLQHMFSCQGYLVSFELQMWISFKNPEQVSDNETFLQGLEKPPFLILTTGETKFGMLKNVIQNPKSTVLLEFFPLSIKKGLIMS